MRPTERFIRVARVLVQEPDAQHWVYETSQKAHLRSGLVYPMFARMEDDGLLLSEWVDQPPRRWVDRLLIRLGVVRTVPKRRAYVLTDKGRQQLGALAAIEP